MSPFPCPLLRGGGFEFSEKVVRLIDFAIVWWATALELRLFSKNRLNQRNLSAPSNLLRPVSREGPN